MEITELAKRLKIEVPDFIDDYSNQIDEITLDNYDDIEAVVEYNYYQDHVSEYADSNTPIYYTDIDKTYDEQTRFADNYSIDEAIENGLCEAMESEADISKAKQCAIYMQIEADTYGELEEFIKELEDKEEEIKEILDEQ